MSKTIIALRLTCVFSALATGFIANTGCDKQDPIQPSQPAARAPNRSPAPSAPTTSPAAAATDDPSRVEMGTRRSTVAPITPPTDAATPAAAPTEMVLPRPAQDDRSTDPAVATFAGLTAPKPRTWQWRAPSNAMRVAEYSVPGVEGADQAQMVVFQFAGGGTVDQNIARWKTQFRSSDGSEIDPKVQEVQAEELKVTLVEIAGEYRGMGKAEFTPDQLFLSGIIDTGGNPVFVQLVGPARTVEANRESFMTLLRGLKRSDPMK
jgi:hypothetical protein